MAVHLNSFISLNNILYNTNLGSGKTILPHWQSLMSLMKFMNTLIKDKLV